MRILKLKKILFTFLSLTILLSSCEELFPKDDPCDKTVADEISVKIRVKILDNLDSNLSSIEIDVYKIPCGAPRKGDFHFEGETVEGFYQQDYEVGYNLRNTGDVIKVEVKATNVFAKIDLYQTLEYSYNDFTNGELKDPLLYFEFLE